MAQTLQSMVYLIQKETLTIVKALYACIPWLGLRTIVHHNHPEPESQIRPHVVEQYAHLASNNGLSCY